MCAHCGTYRKREVIDIAKAAEKKAKRTKEKARSLGQEPDTLKKEAGKEAKKESKK